MTIVFRPHSSYLNRRLVNDFSWTRNGENKLKIGRLGTSQNSNDVTTRFFHPDLFNWSAESLCLGYLLTLQGYLLPLQGCSTALIW